MMALNMRFGKIISESFAYVTVFLFAASPCPSQLLSSLKGSNRTWEVLTVSQDEQDQAE